MSLDPRLLALLACPSCKSSLSREEDGASLSCARCARRYPIVDGILDFIGDDPIAS